LARPLIGAGTIGGVFSSFAPTAAAPPPTSPAAGAFPTRAFAARAFPTAAGAFPTRALAASAFPTAAFAASALAASALAASALAASALAAAGLAAARLLFRAGLLGTRDLRPLSARIALCLGSPFGAARCGITAILAARPSTLPRVARSVAPHVAISVAVATVAMPIPVAAAAATIAIVTRIATAKPFALGLGR
jgi:hypothetical protein